MLRALRWLFRGVGALCVGLVAQALFLSNQPIKSGYSIVLFVALAVSVTVLTLTSDFVLSRLHGPTASGLTASFTYAHGQYLVVDIKNAGETMRDAGVSLLVPQALRGPIWPVGAKDHPTRGEGERVTSESLTDDGAPSNLWHAKGFHFLGGGNETQLFWIVGGAAGDYPVRIKVYDDTLRPRSLIEDRTITIPVRKADPAHVRVHVPNMLNELKQERTWIGQSLSTGHYPELTDDSGAILRLTTEGVREAKLNSIDPGREEPELRQAVLHAFAECERVHALSLGLDGRRNDFPILDEDNLERAMVAVLVAIIELEKFEAKANG